MSGLLSTGKNGFQERGRFTSDEVSMRGTNASKTLGLGFDHGLEHIVSQSTLLLKIGADGKHVVIGQGFVQVRSIRGAALGCREAQGRFGRMRCQQRIVAMPRVSCGAGPAVSRRSYGHGPD